jgi:hypothetical protein
MNKRRCLCMGHELHQMILELQEATKSKGEDKVPVHVHMDVVDAFREVNDAIAKLDKVFHAHYDCV